MGPQLQHLADEKNFLRGLGPGIGSKARDRRWGSLCASSGSARAVGLPRKLQENWRAGTDVALSTALGGKENAKGKNKKNPTALGAGGRQRNPAGTCSELPRPHRGSQCPGAPRHVSNQPQNLTPHPPASKHPKHPPICIIKGTKFGSSLLWGLEAAPKYGELDGTGTLLGRPRKGGAGLSLGAISRIFPRAPSQAWLQRGGRWMEQ